MFKKLVSNLPFNPSLIQQVSFYGKRLQQEQAIRKTSFLFIVGALIINIIAISAPAQNTLAGTDGHIVQGGGTSTKAGILQKYDQDPTVQAIYASFGIQRSHIEKMTLQSINTKASWADPLVTAGRRPNGSTGEYPRNVGGITIYVHSLDSAFRADTIQAFVCEATTCGRYLAIAVDCGNPINSVNETTTVQKPEPIGYVDGSNCEGMFGWAFNNQYARYVHIYVNRSAFSGAVKDTDYFEVSATQDTRPDVSSVFSHIPSSVGWSWNGGPLAGDGRDYKVWVYVTDRGSNFALLTDGDGRSVNFTCPKPPAVVICPSGTLAGQPAPGNLLSNCPEAKIAECISIVPLSRTVEVEENARFTMRSNVQNGASVQGYRVNFGDGQTRTYNTTETEYTVTHQYQSAGTYQVVLTVLTSEGERTSNSCGAEIVISERFVPCSYDPSLSASDDACQPCPENPNVAASNPEVCTVTKVLKKKVANITKNIDDANNTQASPGDILEYSLYTKNTARSLNTEHTTIENIADILDYSEIESKGDASVDVEKNITWPKTTILAGQELVQTFRVKVKATIPSTEAATANSGTFDLKMLNIYGNETTVTLPCPIALCAQNTVSTLPNTGPGTSLVVTFLSVCIIGFFYSRSRVLAKEVEIIKYDYANGGA